LQNSFYKNNTSEMSLPLAVPHSESNCEKFGQESPSKSERVVLTLLTFGIMLVP